jgi:transcriptional regulator with XRE-family HTH domain
MRRALTLSTGRDFAAVRLASGIGRRPLATLLGVTFDTLARWETSQLPVESERATRWRNALVEARKGREKELAAMGFTFADLTRGAQLCGLLAAS